MIARFNGAVVTLVVVGLTGTAQIQAGEQGQEQAAPAQVTASASPKFTLEGKSALWTVAIKPDKASDFESIMARLREALLNSDSEERRKQAVGWRLLKIDKMMPDGNIAYVHVIDPVVPGADYSVMKALYDAFPEERWALYEKYRGAFANNLSLATGAVVLDMSRQTQTAATAVP